MQNVISFQRADKRWKFPRECIRSGNAWNSYGQVGFFFLMLGMCDWKLTDGEALHKLCCLFFCDHPVIHANKIHWSALETSSDLDTNNTQILNFLKRLNYVSALPSNQFRWILPFCMFEFSILVMYHSLLYIYFITRSCIFYLWCLLSTTSVDFGYMETNVLCKSS